MKENPMTGTTAPAAPRTATGSPAAPASTAGTGSPAAPASRAGTGRPAVAASAAVTAAPARGARRGPRRWRGSPPLTLLAVALGVMMVALDGTIVAVANPAIQSHLGASLADIQWVTNGYLLALAVSLITVGKIGDRFGHKKIFLAGIVGFAATSAAVGLSGQIASSITLVIAFRVAQGAFGAMLQPTALALLRK